MSHELHSQRQELQGRKKDSDEEEEESDNLEEVEEEEEEEIDVEPEIRIKRGMICPNTTTSFGNPIMILKIKLYLSVVLLMRMTRVILLCIGASTTRSLVNGVE